MAPTAGRLALAAMLLAGCSHAQLTSGTPRAEAGSPPVPALETRIDALIGPARCRSDADCRTIALGARACGGPQAYRAWSLRDTDAETLARLAQAHRDARLQQIERSGEMSICALLLDPGSVCRVPAGAAQGQCVLRTPAPGGVTPQTVSR